MPSGKEVVARKKQTSAPLSSTAVATAALMTSNEEEEKKKIILKRKIKDLRDTIKKKHRKLIKTQKSKKEMIAEHFKPLVKPLNDLQVNLKYNEIVKRKIDDVDKDVNVDEGGGGGDDGPSTSRKLLEGSRKIIKKYHHKGEKRKSYKIRDPTDEHDVDEEQRKRFIVDQMPMEQQPIIGDEERMDIATSTPLPPETDREEEEEFSSPVRVGHPQQQQQPSSSSSTSTDDSVAEIKKYIDKNFTGELAKKFFTKYLQGHESKQIDTTYGPKIENDEWKLGTANVRMNGDDFIINGKKFKGTKGLYKLIFLRTPDINEIPDEDIKTYKKILDTTNAHLNPNGYIKSNRGYKYRYIISKMFTKPKLDVQRLNLLYPKSPSGSGMILNDNKIDYTYWDDPNELVDRLELLLASYQTGNNAHVNEIYSIIEELREASIIKGGGKAFLKSLTQ